MPYPIPTCCERGCDKPIDRPRSKVRCVDHYTPPTYGGHNPRGSRPAATNREEPNPHA